MLLTKGSLGLQSERREQREEDLGDGESWAPLVLQDVETDDALGVDIAVVDPGAELHFWRLEGIIGGEVNIQEEDATFIDRSRRAEDGADPLVQIVALRSSAAVWRRIQRYCSKLF